MQFHKELDDTYTLSNINQEQVYLLHSLLEFFSRSEMFLGKKVDKEEYQLAGEISELIAEFLDDEEYCRIMNEE